ncbi:MAG: hypothetical protein H6Q74_3094 [Firmicutes bacterium]|nr:hypothetical protein [Bacillota bacterium]
MTSRTELLLASSLRRGRSPADGGRAPSRRAGRGGSETGTPVLLVTMYLWWLFIKVIFVYNQKIIMYGLLPEI